MNKYGILAPDASDDEVDAFVAYLRGDEKAPPADSDEATETDEELSPPA